MGLTSEETIKLIEESQKGCTKSRTRMIEQSFKLVWYVVNRFKNRGYELEDLFQVGTIGLIKSIDKFNLNLGVKFSTYAVPMIMGEIRRFLRDDGKIKISREIKELSGKIIKFKELFFNSNGRLPSFQEISNALNVSINKISVVEESMQKIKSINNIEFESDGTPITLEEQIAYYPKEFDYIVLKEIINKLEPRDKKILQMRYFEDKTQSEVAQILNLSQVQISRLEKKILDFFRKELFEKDTLKKKNTAKIIHLKRNVKRGQ